MRGREGNQERVGRPHQLRAAAQLQGAVEVVRLLGAAEHLLVRGPALALRRQAVHREAGVAQVQPMQHVACEKRGPGAR